MNTQTFEDTVKMATKNNKKGRKCKFCKGDVCIHEHTRQADDKCIIGPSIAEQCMEILEKLLKEKENSPEEILKIGSHEELFQLGIDPICVVAAMGNIQAMRRFIDAGANVNDKYITDGSTPLMLATQSRHVEMVDLLLKSGADVTTLNQDRNNSFMLAVKTGDAKLVNALWPYRKNLDINHSNVEGQTVLHYAAEKMWDVCVQFLLTNGSAINAKNNVGWTPLMISAMKGDFRTTEKLLTSGADYFMEDNAGYTAVCWAFDSKKENIIKLILGKMQPKDREHFVKNRVDRMRNPFDEMNTDGYYEEVLIPLLRRLSSKEEFRDALCKQKLVPNLLALFQKHVKNQNLLSGACCVCCLCMCQHAILVDEQFTQQFIRARGPEICLKALKTYKNTHKGDNETMVICFLPLVCIYETREGKDWLEKNSMKVAQHSDLKQQYILVKYNENNLTMKGKMLWDGFWIYFEQMQQCQRDRQMAELLEEEEKERFRKSKKKEKKKEKRQRQHQNRVTTKQTTEPKSMHAAPTDPTTKSYEQNLPAAVEEQKDVQTLCMKESTGKKEKHSNEDMRKRNDNTDEECRGVGISEADDINEDNSSISEILSLSNLNSDGNGTWVTVQGKKDKQKANVGKIEFGDFDFEIKSEKKDKTPKIKINPKERKTKKKRWADVAKNSNEKNEEIKSSSLPPAAAAGFDVTFGAFDYEEDFPTLGGSILNVKRESDITSSDDFMSTDNTVSDEWKYEIYSSPSVSNDGSEFDIATDNIDLEYNVNKWIHENCLGDKKDQPLIPGEVKENESTHSTQQQPHNGKPQVLMDIAKSILVNEENNELVVADKSTKSNGITITKKTQERNSHAIFSTDVADTHASQQNENRFSNYRVISNDGPRHFGGNIGASESENWTNSENIPSAKTNNSGVHGTIHPEQNDRIIEQCIQQLLHLQKNIPPSYENTFSNDFPTAHNWQGSEKEQGCNQASRSEQNIAVIQPIGHSLKNKQKVVQEKIQNRKFQSTSDVSDISMVDSLMRNVASLAVSEESEDILFPSDLRDPQENGTQQKTNDKENDLPIFPGFHDDTQTTAKQNETNKRLEYLLQLQLAGYYYSKCGGDGVEKSIFNHDFPFYSSAMGIKEETVKEIIEKLHPNNKSYAIPAQKEVEKDKTPDKIFPRVENMTPLPQLQSNQTVLCPGLTTDVENRVVVKGSQNEAYQPQKRVNAGHLTETKSPVYHESKYQQTDAGKEHRSTSQQTVQPEVNADVQFKWSSRSKRWKDKLGEIMNMSPACVKRVGDIYFPQEYQHRYTVPYTDEPAVLGFMKDGREIAVHIIDMSSRSVTHSLLTKMTSPEMSHYFLVKYRAFAIEGNSCYLAMDLYEYTLVEYLDMLQLDISLDPLSVNKLVWQLLKGLASLHSNYGLLHGNIMPSNVLVDIDGTLKLSEYGLPRRSHCKRSLISSLSVNADRDCWVPTEVVTETEEYSSKSDIQVTGMMLYYVLSGGKHPYGANNLEIQVSIHQNWPQMIYLTEEVNNLLSMMLCMPPADRPDVNDLLKHPYFWAEEKRLRFVLIAGSDVLRDMKLGVPTTGGVGDTMIDILNNGNSGTTPTDWISQVDSVIMREMRSFRQYKNTLVELVLFVYNCCLHFDKLSQEARDVLDEPCKYFLTKFPTLFMSVYRAIKKSERSQKICYKPFF